jgi:DASS family divalent anion:Na+ symporter
VAWRVLNGAGVNAKRGVFLAIAAVLWWWPAPEGLTLEAWRLFVIVASAIGAVVANALPLLTASVLAVAATVLGRVLTPEQAYAGFANGTILLIVLAFLVARSVLTSGLGVRIGHWMVGRFGRSAIGLSYSIFLVDGLIAPAFPSSTARSGVIFPMALSLANAAGATPEATDRRRLGTFLMFSGIASISLSSALWLTAMAGNPLGAELARHAGVEIAFGSWLVASSVPTLTAMLLMPLLLRRCIGPEVHETPEAPALARRALAALGPLKYQEKVVIAAFGGMVGLWAVAATLSIDSTAVAFLGLAVLLLTGVLTPADLKKEGDVLATFIWFAVLFALCGSLNELGFIAYLGSALASVMGRWGAPAAYVMLISAYVVLHYMFVSQTAHLLALFGVFLDVGIKTGLPAALLAYQLLFANNYFAGLTPQGSSANVLFASSGLISQRDLYVLGAIATGFNMAVFLIVGTPWLWLITR